MHTTRWILVSLLAVTSLSCNRHAVSLSELTDRAEKLTEQNTLISQEIRELRRAYNKELDAKEEDFAGYASAIKTLNDTAESMRLSMLAFGDYKREYRRATRAKAPGMALGDLAVGSRTLREIKVKEVTDTHIAMVHKDGSTRIPLAEAPPSVQDLFAYDPSLDVLLKETSGTGTDWLLSAMATAQQFAASQVEAVPRPARVAAAGPNQARPTASTPTNAYAGYNTGTSYYQDSRPTWQRFSNFTGSFWSPLQNRKKVVGTVNTFSSGMLDCPY
jgi:type II secretory pathway pseudopilin PulG